MSGQGCQPRFGPSHSKEVLRTCLGLICGHGEWVCHAGRVSARKRREGRAPNMSAARDWGQEGARGPEPTAAGVLLGPVGPCFPRPCPTALRAAGGAGRQTSRPPGQSGLSELRATGWQGESPSPQSPPCPAQMGSSPTTAMERHPLASDARASSVPTPMPLLLQSQPCPVHCAWGLGAGVHLGPGRQEGLAVLVWDGAGSGFKGMGVAGGGGGRWHLELPTPPGKAWCCG